MKYVVSKQDESGTYAMPSHNSVTSNAIEVVGYSKQDILNMMQQSLEHIKTMSQYNLEQEEAERQRLHEWNMKQIEEWSKTKEQKLEEMLAQTTKHVLSYCFNIDKESV